MKSIIVFMLLLFGIAAGCSSQAPRNLLFDGATLERNRDQITRGDDHLKTVLDNLTSKADLLLKEKPHSVTEKTTLPPSGDVHDYVSLSGYYWPDPSKPDGLPYIRIDGKQNPETRKARDRVYLKELGEAAEVLGLAYYYTQDEKYAEHLASRLRVWFLDEETKMNPNLKFAAGKPGIQDGGPAGSIHAKYFVDILEAERLIAKSESWTDNDHEGLKKWVEAFLDWTLNSDLGKKASKLKNNIGTAYDMQVLAYALFTGNKPVINRILKESVPKRMDSQFTVDGKQPEELKRADAWIYSCSNLEYWFNIARYAELAGVDLWNYETPSGKSIMKAFNWMQPYAQNSKKWTYGTASKRANMAMGPFRRLERRVVSRTGENGRRLSESNLGITRRSTEVNPATIKGLDAVSVLTSEQL